MAVEFTIKENDTSPSIACLLSYSDLSIPDLTGATVRFKMKLQSGGTLINQLAEIVDVPTGKVRYGWVAADTAVAGVYNAEWEVTFADLEVGSFPNTGFIELEVKADLD